MTGYQADRYGERPRPAAQVGTISPDGLYVFTGTQWVPRAAAVRKSHTAAWAVGIAAAVAVAVVVVGVGALVLSRGLRDSLSAGDTVWSATALEESIRSDQTEAGLDSVACVATATDDWFVCSWRRQGDTDSYVYTVETSGTRWRSSDALFMGTVAELTAADVDALVTSGVPTQPAPELTTPPPAAWDPTANGYKDCGGGVYGNEVTSCPFALNVAGAYRGSGGSPVLPDVYSPVTGQTYTMTCTGGAEWGVCRGGQDAEVLVRADQ